MKRFEVLMIGIAMGLAAASSAKAAEENVDKQAEHGGKSGKAVVKGTSYRGSYFVNGEIHVNTYGTPEGKPVTSGHQDFKPSWSKTGDMLVFFRRLKHHPITVNWITQICIINVDGTGFHQLTDGYTRGFQSDLDAGRNQHADLEPGESGDG